ncbi:AzlC family ABC transporter permease [Pseudonocardia acaciae]|uniref:AzlC family ABC transporter permease n=1 Tax=Pseudonocardia acaciae TaxID=551276 RepID=UPI000491C2C0|nr:AzlC family ABC transporter permease [Pseudonocardia acaciae]
MRSTWRTGAREDLRDALALGAAILVVGASFGALAATARVPLVLIVAMSLLVFAGGSQFLAVAVVAAGGAPVAAVLGGLLLNARHFPFGLAVADVVGRSWPARLVGSHFLLDESVAFARARRDPVRARRAYWMVGVTMFLAWNLGTVVGAFAGSAVPEPARFGIDAAFPAALLALLLPTLREADAARVAVAGAALALAVTPWLPAGVPVLVALAALLAAGRPVSK